MAAAALTARDLRDRVRLIRSANVGPIVFRQLLVRYGAAGKALDALPRHRRIVARVTGDSRAQLVTNLVAFGEVGLGAWMLVGRFLPVCIAIQTVALVAMNALELRYARDLLFSPVLMVCANAALLAGGWYVALHGP